MGNRKINLIQERKCIMQKKHILKVLSLLAVVCITAGCNGSTMAETVTLSTTTTAQITTAVTTSVLSKETNSEFSELAEAEIDYVDENGEIFYKNPTEWTFEKVFKELRINGQQFESPLTFDKLGEGFEFSDGEYDTTYSSSNNKISKMIKLRDKYFCSVTFLDCKDENDYDKPFHELVLTLSGTNEEYRHDITINGIGIGATAKDVIEKLGVPYSEFGGGLIYTASNVNKTFGTLSLGFYEGKLSIMTISLHDDIE